MKKNKQGFTLIELLVVIAIIGLLSTLTVLALNSARARARDAKRVADVKQIQTALELYFNDMNDYPATASVQPSSTIFTSNGTYLQSVPVAPTPADGNCTTTSNTYSYTYRAGTPVSYTLNYCLGGSTAGAGAGLQTATPAGIR
jgi:prepilin-type N-terminal cleavage/methylation domain-containing protein